MHLMYTLKPEKSFFFSTTVKHSPEKKKKLILGHETTQ